MSHKQNIFLLSHVVLLLVILSFIDFFSFSIYMAGNIIIQFTCISILYVLSYSHHKLQFCYHYNFYVFNFFFSVRHSDWLSLIYVSHYLCRLFLVLHVFITFFKFVSYLHSWIMYLSSLLHYYHCCSTNVVSCLFVTPSPLKKKAKIIDLVSLLHLWYMLSFAKTQCNVFFYAIRVF